MLAALYLLEGCEKRGALVFTPRKVASLPRKLVLYILVLSGEKSQRHVAASGAMAQGLRRCLRGAPSV